MACSGVMADNPNVQWRPIRPSQDWQPQRPIDQPWRKPQFKKAWHFCKSDFQYDEWFCRICDRFDPELVDNPVFYLECEAIEHETTSRHQYYLGEFHKSLAKHPAQLKIYRDYEMGWGPTGDLLFPDEVYDNVAWHIPDVRRGVDFLNQFVTFWIDDVAAAEQEPDDEEHKKTARNQARRLRAREKGEEVEMPMPRRSARLTFEEFFDTLEFESDEWTTGADCPYGVDGWGEVAVPNVQVNVSGLTGRRKGDSNTGGWVVQKAARGRGRGKGRGKGQGRRQRNPNRKEENKAVGNDNLFAQLRVDDET